MRYFTALLSAFLFSALIPNVSFASKWDEVLKEHREQLQILERDYAKNILQTHQFAVKSHFALVQLEAVAEFQFMADFLTNETFQFDSSKVSFATYQFPDPDPALLWINRNFAIVYLKGMEGQLARMQIVQNEMNKFVKVGENLCNESYLQWPRAYYNPETLFAPRFRSVQESPSFQLDFEIGIGYSRSFGGSQPSRGTVNPSFKAYQSEKYDEAGRAVCSAVGAAVGSYYCPGVGTAVGGVVGAISYDLSKITVGYFKDYLGDVFTYREVVEVVSKMNEIMAKGTPKKSYSDEFVAKSCNEQIDLENTIKQWKLMLARFENEIVKRRLDLKKSQQSFSDLDQSFKDHLAKNAALFSSPEFARKTAGVIGEQLLDYRQWNQRTRDLDQDMKEALRDLALPNADYWTRLNKLQRLDTLILQSELILKPLASVDYRTLENAEVRPLHRTLILARSAKAQVAKTLVGNAVRKENP